MPRKRKVAVNVPVVENDENLEPSDDATTEGSKNQHGPMYNIMTNAQLNETSHNKYIKEMQRLYKNMDHDAFMFKFIQMLKSAMAAEETSEYANTTLLFSAKFVASYDGEETHPILASTFKWVLTTISNNPHIRFRLCQFVNMVLNALGIEAALDDTICDNILTYMIGRLRDLNPNVRVQAILALQRLQIPDNPDDIVVKTYQFHLSSDPSPRVRQAVITSMGRNFNTIPYIMERLWDIDEKVRRHTYFHMSSYPVKAYKVSQRLTFLEQGLNDRSEMVRKVVSSVMLPQWLESYNRNIVALISSLKLDANEAEIDRFRKIAKMTLAEIFKRQKQEDLINALPLEVEEGGEYEKCIPYEKLTVEDTLYWLCLIEHLQNENVDEIDSIIPELTTFCNYVKKYCEAASKINMDKWQKMEYQYILLTLMEIVNTFDLGDEIGRENLKILLESLLKSYDIEEQTIKVIIQCTEKLITKQEDRLQFFVDIIKEMSEAKSVTNELSHDRTLIDELLEKHPDKNLKFKVSSLKVKMLDLEEQETNFVQRKDYAEAQRISELLIACREEFDNLLKPILSEVSSTDDESSRKFMSLTFQQKKLSPEGLIKSLQIAYYMVVSKNVKSLTPNVCVLYKDFIRRHVESNQIVVRDWALKCGTAYSMLYEPLSKDVYTELNSQFFKNHNVRLWKTAIECIFELLDRYGCSHFEVEDKHNKSRGTGRQLYNTLESIDAEEDTSTSSGVDLIFMMSHFLDTLEDNSILTALVYGFCRLILHGHVKNEGIIEKLLLKYFNPITDPEINQILGVFFENLIIKKKQEYLQPCLLPTISTIMVAPYDSPFHEIKPENVLRFVIDSTRPIYCSSGQNIHNTIALSFLQEMQNNISNKELLKILARELITLEVLTVDALNLREDMRSAVEKLMQCDIDPRTGKYLENFREILDGVFNPNQISVRTTTGKPDGSDEENAEGSEEEDENRSSTKETETQKRGDVDILQALIEEPEEEDREENNANSENVTQETITSDVHVENRSAEAEQDKQSEELVEETSANEANVTKPHEIDTLTQRVSEYDKETQPVPVEQRTPTTFGSNNSTNLRYLRKSLNVLQRSIEELSPKKRKIRSLEQNTNSSRSRRNLQNASPQKQDKQHSKRANRSAESNSTFPSEKSTSIDNHESTKHDKTKDIVEGSQLRITEEENELPEDVSIRETQSDCSEEFEPLVVSDGDVVESEDDVHKASSIVDSDVDEIQASPQPVPTSTIRSKRIAERMSKLQSKTETKNQKKTPRTKSVQKGKAKESLTTENEKVQRGRPKRRQCLFTSPETEKSSGFISSPLRKQPRTNLEISEKLIKTPQIETNSRKNASGNEHQNSVSKDKSVSKKDSGKTSVSKDKSVSEKGTNKTSLSKDNSASKKDSGKTSVSKIHYSVTSDRNPHQTRNTSKQNYLLNNIMTRKKISPDKSPVNQRLLNSITNSSSKTRLSKEKTNTDLASSIGTQDKSFEMSSSSSSTAVNKKSKNTKESESKEKGKNNEKAINSKKKAEGENETTLNAKKTSRIPVSRTMSRSRAVATAKSSQKTVSQPTNKSTRTISVRSNK